MGTIPNPLNKFRDVLETIYQIHGKSFHFLEYLCSNRGVDTGRVIDDESHFYFLKMIDHAGIRENPEFDPEFRIISLQREGGILQKLSDHQIGQYVLHGSNDSFSWIVTHWIDGKSASVMAEELRGSENHDKRFLWLFASLVQVVGSLQGAGFLHGDLQPAHFICTKQGIELVDFGLAREINDTEAPYKGALVHYNAPEVAIQMLRGFDQVAYDLRSEIYSLGATLFYLYTSQVPVDYRLENPQWVPFEQKLQMIVKGQLRSFADSGVSPAPAIEDLLRRFLALNPEDRFESLNEALAAIDELAAAYAR